MQDCPYVGVVEIGGLIVAVVACVIIFYALPARIARRHAVVTSREGDRFSADVTLLAPPDTSEGADRGHGGSALVPKPSTQPLFPAASRARNAAIAAPPEPYASHPTKGTSMTAVPNSREENHPHASEPAPIRKNPAQQMTALRSRRVARLAREQAAVRRRIVTAAVATVFILTFTVLAAIGVLAWAWLALPGAFLAGTVASSVYGAAQAQKQNEAEIEELERIRASSTRLREEMKGRAPGVAKSGTWPGRASSVTKGRAAQSTESGSAKRRASATQEKTAAPALEEDRVRAQVKMGGEDVVAPAVPAAAEEPAEAPEPTVEVDLEVRREQSWNVTKLPPVRYATDEVIVTRQVHADTDLVPVSEHRGEGVPGRPIRKSPRKSADVATTADLTGPTFKFDLDAVLDQRRAQ